MNSNTKQEEEEEKYILYQPTYLSTTHSIAIHSIPCADINNIVVVVIIIQSSNQPSIHPCIQTFIQGVVVVEVRNINAPNVA